MAIIIQKIIWVLWRDDVDSACFAFEENDAYNADFMVCFRTKKDAVEYKNEHDLRDYTPLKIHHKNLKQISAQLIRTEK